MKKIFKKNQIIITALAIMIMVAGYLNYMGGADYDGAKEASTKGEDLAEVTDISQEDMSASETVVSEEDVLAEMLKQNTDDTTGSAVGAQNNQESSSSSSKSDTAQANGAVETAQADSEGVVGEATLVNGVATIDYIAEAKLNREQVRSRNKEVLLELINNNGLSEGQKNEAVESMIALTDVAEKELAAETLLSAKGFTDSVVSIHEDGVDVVIKADQLDDAKRAQIEDVVKRKTGVEAKNIVITPIAK